jgi:hypothetical protein
MDDITPATRRMTYAELGQARGISAKSAERLVRRRHWPRQVGNDGIARVMVPLGEDAPAEHVAPRHHGGYPGMTAPQDSDGHPPVTAPRDIEEVVREAIRDAVTPLTAQLERAEQRLDDERARADRAERTVANNSATITDLQCQVADAVADARAAHEEAAVARTRLAAMMARGWWARLRNKTP